MSEMPRTEPARGMRDFLPEDVRRREYVIGVIKRVYERYGFEPLETPAVENLETLLGKYGDEGNQLIFKILKRGEHEASGQADLALRYDLTVPLARVVAQHQAKLPRLFKRYQIQPVWRADRPARGRFREFYQCDVDCARVDVAGRRSGAVCAAVADALTELGFDDFVIRLNHRQLLTALLSAAGVRMRRCTAPRSWRSTSWTRLAATASPPSSRSVESLQTPPRSCWRCSMSGGRPSGRPLPRPRTYGGVRGRRCDRAPRMREPASRFIALTDGHCAAGKRMRGGPEPGARAVVLHGRDHGDQRRRPGRQPWRRRALRQSGRACSSGRTSPPAASRSASSGSWS